MAFEELLRHRFWNADEKLMSEVGKLKSIAALKRIIRIAAAAEKVADPECLLPPKHTRDSYNK
jgi:hypothetical protein